ncbi:MAG: ribonuclease E activity regulator RraA [Burkholderiales bacterium]|nr:ribonuclease E activity regulator RraA [Burkholderiales bacterium]
MNTCDLCDLHKNADPGTFRVFPGSRWRSYGGCAAFAGPVRTVRCLDDNSLVKAAVEGPGEGHVLVVDGGMSLRRSLLGGKLASAAARNGWAGLLIHGAVRDLAELRAQPIGILALGHVPLATERAGQGRAGLTLLIDGTPVRPGEWLMADEDGVLVMAERPA